MEANTAAMLKQLDVTYDVPDIEIEAAIRNIEKKTEMELDEHQAEAVKEAVRNGLLVITGGPGTGKTTTINTIIKYFELEGMDIFLAAPTGRAPSPGARFAPHSAPARKPKNDQQKENTTWKTGKKKK